MSLHTFPLQSTLQWQTSIFLHGRTVTLPHSRRITLPPPRHCYTIKVVRSLMREDQALEAEEAELLLATCITRTLPPALTLQHGLDKIKDSLAELKSKPPLAKSGMYRFQIAVSPGLKALSMLCFQPVSTGVFPQFFVSTNLKNSTSESVSLGNARGVFGIGAAIYIRRSYTCSSAEEILLQRGNLVDSSLPLAFGLLGRSLKTPSNSIKYEGESFYMFIPQIELVEYDGLSILASTLAWSDSSLCAFDEAVQFIINLCSRYSQASLHIWPFIDSQPNKCISAVLKKFNMAEEEDSLMVYINALSLSGRDFWNEPMELKEASWSCQFLLRLSPTVAISNNMLANLKATSCSLKDNSNINTLWASLIVEECYRLGLTYFCVAPGSRSSPLAIAASSHPFTTCIACFDERSLAFHAIGYARGSHRPAVVITSSGTAVSNLLPAVVEAYQDFLPLVLLTADRPPELQDSGANQAINQVNHFGSFVRHSVCLPAPTDNIFARVVLTTIDSAVHFATSSPCGPVHINCPFREPLDNSKMMWKLSCLKGLDFWVSSAQPFTQYLRVNHSFACQDTYDHVTDIIKIIQGAKRGLLLIGGIHKDDDIWAILLLAKHLCWPVVPDILSGLRLRKYKNSVSLRMGNCLFVDHLDHILLSEEVRQWVDADVVVQIGSRITSKRISQLLEDSSPCSYILVDSHPHRHDPSHILTHRIQSTVTQFASSVLRACEPHPNNRWTCFLQTLDMMVAWEISFLIHSEYSLTEPYVAHVTTEALDCGSALFIGNSMPIRDADMYGSNQGQCNFNIDMLSTTGLQCHWIQVAGNRGASGIDGLLSTAVGFAVGSNKRVVCILGDVSLLHDTNGLALLKQRIPRKWMTVLVINNHGGAIFSLLPIADRTDQNLLNQFFYTSHDVGIQNLCMAHNIKHVKVQTKLEFQDALVTSQQEEIDCVIEVDSCIDTNAAFHRKLRNFACQGAHHALSILSRLAALDSSSNDIKFLQVYKLEYSRYRVQLSAPVTSAPFRNDHAAYKREGFVLSLSLEDGRSIGFGEVAPLQMEKESLLDVEDQLRFLIHAIKGAKLSLSLPMLKGSFSSWIWANLGIPPASILPSVRCGLEMAILNAIAASQNSSLLNILYPLAHKQDISESLLNVHICALIDSNGTPMEVASIAATLVEEGFTAIKLKVGRRANPTEDAAVIQEIRKKVGYHIKLRADANRKWSFDEASQFSSCVKDCELQYIEEPVRDEDDIIKFCEASGLAVALDETIEHIQDNPLHILQKFTHQGVVAIVIKPSIVGGFENAALIARWAQHQGKMAVVSAAYESGLGLSAFVQLSCYLELQNVEICKLMNKSPAPLVAHGLGTYRWFKEDVMTESMCIHRNEITGIVEASAVDAGQLLRNFQINPKSIVQTFRRVQVRCYQLTVNVDGLVTSVNVQEIGQDTNNNVIVFLHGFLGTCEDWIPIMKALSGSVRCVAIDLPGHGRSRMLTKDGSDSTGEPNSLSIKAVADMLCNLFPLLTSSKLIVVGYSMGARISLYMALRCSNKVKGVVMISGSPGLNDETTRKLRRAKDDSRARALVAHGLDLFLESWYSEDLWLSLRGHPQFEQIVASRLKHDDVHALGNVLSDLSIGRQPSLWQELKNVKLPLLHIVGEKDLKFKNIAQAMHLEFRKSTRTDDPEKCDYEVVEISDCGHAVHLENPLPVVKAIRQFLRRLKKLNP